MEAKFKAQRIKNQVPGISVGKNLLPRSINWSKNETRSCRDLLSVNYAFFLAIVEAIQQLEWR